MRPRAIHCMVLALLGILALVAYANSFRGELIFDSRAIIVSDPRLRELRGNNLSLILTKNYWWPMLDLRLYRPVTTLSYLFNYAILHERGHAAGYHAVNLLLHWINACLVYALGLLLFNRVTPAFFMAALFELHPLATEGVTNVVGRADEFATLSVLGGLLLYARSTRLEGRDRLPWLLGLSGITLFGVFAKENAVAIAGVLVLYDLMHWEERRRAPWLERLGGYIALGPPFALLWLARSWVFANSHPREYPFVDNPLFTTNFWLSRLTAVKVIGKYLWLLVWPRSLSADYSYNQIPLVRWPFHTWEDWKALVALCSVIALLLIAGSRYRRNKPLLFLILFFFVTLLPTANLFFLTGSIMAERFLYLPLVGFAGCVVVAVYSIPAIRWRRAIAPAVLGLLVVACGIRTFARNPDWDNDETLATKSVQVAPDNFKSHVGLASAILQRDPMGAEVDHAIHECETGLRILEMLPARERHAMPYMALSACYLRKGDRLSLMSHGRVVADSLSRPWYEKALATLQRGMAIDAVYNDLMHRVELTRGFRPEQVKDFRSNELYFNLGQVYFRLQAYPDAMEAYRQAQRLKPEDPSAYFGMAEASEAAGRLDEAVISLLELTAMSDRDPAVWNRVLDLYRRLDPGCAIASFRGSSSLNVECPLVHDQICTGFARMAQVFRETNNLDRAQQIRQVALKKHACAAVGEAISQR